MIRPVLLLFGILSAAVVVTGAARAAGDVGEVSDCMRANFPGESSVQDLRFVSRDHLGNEREILATLTWRSDRGLSRALVRVNAPEDLRDSAVLLIEKRGGADLFLYLPELRKTRRITTHTLSGNLFGSDFTYEDFQHLQGMAVEGETERLPDADVDGVAAFVLAHHPAPESGSMYERVVSFVARESCLLMKAEMWQSGEHPRKVLRADLDAVFEHDGVRLPRRVVLEDVKRGSSTRLELVKIDLEKRVRPADVSLTALGR